MSTGWSIAIGAAFAVTFVVVCGMVGGCARSSGHAVAAGAESLPPETQGKHDKTLRNPLSKPEPGFKTEPFHRFKPGDRWTYSIKLPKATATSVIIILPETVRSPDGKDCRVMQGETTESTGATSIDRAVIWQDENGSQHLLGTASAGETTFRWGVKPFPSSARVKSPLYPGQQWLSTFYLEGDRRQLFQCSVLKSEKVSVPSGKFDALVAYKKTIYTTRDQVERIREEDAWIVPRIGLPVRAVTHTPAGPITQELVEYHLE